MVKKGVITSIMGEKARVMSTVKEGDISKPLPLAAGLKISELKKGMEVAYVVFEDMTGVIIARL